MVPTERAAAARAAVEVVGWAVRKVAAAMAGRLATAVAAETEG